MILIIGAMGAGKLSYLRDVMGCNDDEIADGVLDDRPVVYNLQNLVFADPSRVDELERLMLEKSIVVCNEVGAGVIPLERSDREARDTTGRLCVRLARAAHKVVRLVCGIPIILKDEGGE